MKDTLHSMQRNKDKNDCRYSVVVEEKQGL